MSFAKPTLTESTISFTIDRDNKEIELEVEGYISEFFPGKFCGPMDGCYPDEGGEAEIVSISLDGKPYTEPLTEQERIDILEALQESIFDGSHDFYDCDEYDDY